MTIISLYAFDRGLLRQFYADRNFPEASLLFGCSCYLKTV